MSQVLVNFRIDNDIKHSLENICNELGMNLSTAFNMFARKMVKEKRIPFDLSVDSNLNYDTKVCDKALNSFKTIRSKAMKRKTDMSLTEINDYISSIRNERKFY